MYQKLVPLKELGRETMSMIIHEPADDDFKIAPMLLDMNEMGHRSIDFIVYKNNIHKKKCYKKFELLSAKIGKLVRLAEIINRELYKFLVDHIEKVGIDTIIAQSSDIKKILEGKELNQLDFMKLSRLLSYILNSDNIVKNNEFFNSKSNRKQFTKTLYDYIIDRNFYTHGYLYFLGKDLSPVLKVMHEKVECFVIIHENTLSQNIEAFKYLDEKITDLGKILKYRWHIDLDKTESLQDEKNLP